MIWSKYYTMNTEQYIYVVSNLTYIIIFQRQKELYSISNNIEEKNIMYTKSKMFWMALFSVNWLCI